MLAKEMAVEKMSICGQSMSSFSDRQATNGLFIAQKEQIEYFNLLYGVQASCG